MKKVIIYILRGVCCIAIVSIILYWLYLFHWTLALLIGSIIGLALLLEDINREYNQ